MLKKHYFRRSVLAETQNNDFYLFVFIIICYYIIFEFVVKCCFLFSISKFYSGLWIKKSDFSLMCFFTFITGRTPVISNQIYEIIKPNVPYGCIKGETIYDVKKEKYIYKIFLHKYVVAHEKMC